MSCSRSSTSWSSSTGRSTCSPAVRSSDWGSHGPSSTTRRCFFSTSPLRVSTRGAGSSCAAWSYLAVFALTVGTVIVFGLAVSVTQQTVPAGAGAAPFETTQSRPDRVWSLLAPNPFVIVADAAPRPAVRAAYVTELDLLGELGRAARSVRYEVTVQGTQTATDKAVWPYGLAANLLLGAGAVALTTRRLKAPYARLPKAVRVA